MAASTSHGKLVAQLLYQSWCANTLPPEITQSESATIASLVAGSGTAGLAWARIRESHLKESPLATEFLQAYRLHALHAATLEEDIKSVITLLRAAEVDPVLIKGWAIARSYPDTALRPYGDIDLCVRESEYSAASEICDSPDDQRHIVDLHGPFREPDGVNTDELYERSQLVKLGDVDVRVPCAEDNLRILSLHFLRHGAWRPLWLCDIAVAVETRPENFNWDLCLGSNRRTAHWIACCIGLAHQLLGARIEDTPIKQRANALPSWLIPTVLKQWEKPFNKDHGVGKNRAPMAKYIRHPRGLLTDLTRRWPNPIEATAYMRGPFNELPRWPFQVGECIGRTAKFIARLPKTLHEGRD